MRTLCALILALAPQQKPAEVPPARWAPIPQGTRFSFQWSFSLKYSGNRGGTPQLHTESREVQAELVADQEVREGGSLRIELGTVTWTFANADFEVKVTRDEKGQLKDSVRFLATKEKPAGAEKKGKERAKVFLDELSRPQAFPVRQGPLLVGGTWSCGDVGNGLFDWMLLHEDLTKDGRAAGTTWEQDYGTTDNSKEEPGVPRDETQKMKFKASASKDALKVVGTYASSVTKPPDVYGTETSKHSCTKEWSFVDGAFAGGKRTISVTYSRPSKEKFWNQSSTFSVQETLTIRKKGGAEEPKR